MNRKNKLALVAGYGLLAFSGYSQAATEPAMTNGMLVNSAWVEQHRDDIVVVDARGAKEFNSGHIDGAISLGWTELANMSVKSVEPGWGQLNSPEAIQAVLQQKGVKQGQTAVVYTDSKASWGDETRIAWSLQSAGMDIKVLDGGIDAWKGNGYQLTEQVTQYPTGDFVVTELDSSINVTTQELVARIDELVILDTREKLEHKGWKNYGEKVKGVIPNSIHQFFKDFYAEDGKLKDAAAVTAMMDKLGINKDDEIVVYCTGGVRSSAAFYALKQAGYTKVRNYDGSFSDWAATDQPLG